jgi:hypothetical protein
MKTQRFVIVLSLMVLAVMTGLSAAQESEPPLVILSDGELWQWSGDLDQGPERFSACQPPQEPVTSVPVVAPDGRHIAFTAQPGMVREAAARVGYLGDPVPSDIWLCAVGPDIHKLTRVGGQPEGASYFVDGVEDRVSVKFSPVWSPDGGKLAWTEVRQPGSVYWLTIYDLASSTSRSVQLEAEFQSQHPVPLEILWGNTGIFLRELAVPEFVIIYNGEGDFVRTTSIPHMADPKDFITRTLIITDGAAEYVGLHWNYGGWALLDPESGDMQMLADLSAYPEQHHAWPERYHPANPDGISLLLVRRWWDSALWVTTPDSLYVSDSGHTRTFGSFYPDRIALSPAGAIAQMADSILIWRDGVEHTLEMPTSPATSLPYGVSWGPRAWRLRHPAGLHLTPQATCPNLLVSRLAVGVSGRVLPGDPNNLRAEPSPDADLIGQIPGGETFAVIDGPVCGDDLAWWQVDYDGLVGWTVEGQGDHYWLELLR